MKVFKNNVFLKKNFKCISILSERIADENISWTEE